MHAACEHFQQLQLPALTAARKWMGKRASQEKPVPSMSEKKIKFTAMLTLVCDRQWEGCIDFAARSKQTTYLLVEPNR